MCSQACLLAGAEAIDIKNSLLPDIAFALGGGIGMQGDVCGVISGCVLAVSLAARTLLGDDAKSGNQAMEAAARIHRAIVDQFGSSRCLDICGLDLTDPQAAKRLADGVKEQKCLPVVKAAVRLMAGEMNRMSRL